MGALTVRTDALCQPCDDQTDAADAPRAPNAHFAHLGPIQFDVLLASMREATETDAPIELIPYPAYIRRIAVAHGQTLPVEVEEIFAQWHRAAAVNLHKLVSDRTFQLHVLPHSLAVARLASDAAIPEWALHAPLVSITRTSDELSIVAPTHLVPRDAKAEWGFRALRVQGPLDFSEVGVLSSLTFVLAEAGISLFALSTFDTDYLLVRDAQFAMAIDAFRHVGHTVTVD